MFSASKLLRLDVRKQVALVLGVIWLSSIVHFHNIFTFLSPLIAIISCVATEYFSNYLLKKPIFFPISALVSGLIIGLNLPFSTSWHLIITAAILTIILKQVFKYHGRVIFNPTALGLLSASLLIKTQAAWWGVAWNIWLIPFLIITQCFVLKRIKRLWLPITFFLSYSLYLYLKSSENIFPLVFDSTIFFFTFIMLPEPQSSPALKYWQYLFGPLVAINIFFISFFPSFDVDPLLSGLVLANGESLLVKKIKHEI